MGFSVGKSSGRTIGAVTETVKVRTRTAALSQNRIPRVTSLRVGDRLGLKSVALEVWPSPLPSLLLSLCVSMDRRSSDVLSDVFLPESSSAVDVDAVVGWLTGAASAGGSPSMLPQYRHLIAASWISSAQNGHFFTAGRAYTIAGDGREIKRVSTLTLSRSSLAPWRVWAARCHYRLSLLWFPS